MDIGGCESNPCLNDAQCIDLFEDYFCVCPSGTDGKRCQVGYVLDLYLIKMRMKHDSFEKESHKVL